MSARGLLGCVGLDGAGASWPPNSRASAAATSAALNAPPGAHASPSSAKRQTHSSYMLLWHHRYHAGCGLLLAAAATGGARGPGHASSGRCGKGRGSSPTFGITRPIFEGTFQNRIHICTMGVMPASRRAFALGCARNRAGCIARRQLRGGGKLGLRVAAPRQPPPRSAQKRRWV